MKDFIKGLFSLQFFADAGTNVNATATMTNAYTGDATPRENGGSSVPVSIGNDYASMREKFAKMTSEERRAYIRAARPPR